MGAYYVIKANTKLEDRGIVGKDRKQEGVSNVRENKGKIGEPWQSDLEEFEVFMAGILRWLKMNNLLGLTSTDMQVSYLCTCLSSEAQEWFYHNVEWFDHQVQD